MGVMSVIASQIIKDGNLMLAPVSWQFFMFSMSRSIRYFDQLYIVSFVVIYTAAGRTSLFTLDGRPAFVRHTEMIVSAYFT